MCKPYVAEKILYATHVQPICNRKILVATKYNPFVIEEILSCINDLQNKSQYKYDDIRVE